MNPPAIETSTPQKHEASHTSEHILNRTMVNMFGCPRSRNAHIGCKWLMKEVYHSV